MCSELLGMQDKYVGLSVTGQYLCVAQACQPFHFQCSLLSLACLL